MSIKNRIKWINFYPPYLGAAIKVKEINPEFNRIVTEMPMTKYNKNAVGTHFGGSMYAMCDPFYMFIIMEHLGKDYIVWDKAATIRFKKPGTGTITAVFEIPMEEIKKIKEEIDEIGKKDYEFHTVIRNGQNEVVAEVDKVVYVRKKDFKLHQVETKEKEILITQEV